MVDRMVRGWDKWRIGRSALALLLGLSGCGGTVVDGSEGTDGSADVPDDCVGDYEGNFDGDIRGRLTGHLDSNADFQVTFVQSGNGQSATGTGSVAKDGGIEVVLGPNSVTGRFNFARCRASGDWLLGEAQGGWNAELQ